MADKKKKAPKETGAFIKKKKDMNFQSATGAQMNVL